MSTLSSNQKLECTLKEIWQLETSFRVCVLLWLCVYFTVPCKDIESDIKARGLDLAGEHVSVSKWHMFANISLCYSWCVNNDLKKVWNGLNACSKLIVKNLEKRQSDNPWCHFPATELPDWLPNDWWHDHLTFYNRSLSSGITDLPGEYY